MTHPSPQHSAHARRRAETDASTSPIAEARPGAQHAARARRAARIGVVFAIVGAAALLVGTTAAVTAAVAGGQTAAGAHLADDEQLGAASTQTPPPIVSSPTPVVTPTPVTVAPCVRPGVASALKKGDDAAVVAAMGGGAAMRAAVVAGNAPCIDLGDPKRTWVVVDKIRPFDPVDYRPTLGPVDGVRSLSGGWLRKDAGAAMTKLVAAARKAGVGELAMESAFRSYETQVKTYNGHVSSKGRAEADRVSARPGYSEHQSGLAADVVACGGGCSGLDALASTAQGKWLKQNAWRYGYIVRYEKCCTKTTGYSPEPWHVRFIGTALAKAYHDGGFHTLEEFWGLPAAPDYAD